MKKQTAWRLYQCSNGGRFTSSVRLITPHKCNISGCGKDGCMIEYFGVTFNVKVASEWFNRPQKQDKK